MKKLVIIGLSLLSFGWVNAQTEEKAQTKLTPEQRTEKYVVKMQQEVGLDETQKQKVYDLRLEKVKKVKEIREANKGDQEAIKTKVKPIVKEYNEGLKEILNGTQLEKWKAHRKVERTKMKANMEKRKANKSAKAKENPLEDDDLMDSLEEE